MSTIDAQLSPVEVFSRSLSELTDFIGLQASNSELQFTGVTMLVHQQMAADQKRDKHRSEIIDATQIDNQSGGRILF